MKILIPENTLLLTSQGFCFPKDISYGTEIFILNVNQKLSLHQIIEDLEEPEEYLVHTLIFENQTSTIIPNYKIINDEKLIDVKTIHEDDDLDVMESKYIQEFLNYQNEKIVDFSEKSPLSAIVAKYLALCDIDERKEKAVFEKPDNESASQFNIKLQNELKELGGEVTRLTGLKGAFSKITDVQKIYFSSNVFYNFRKQFDLKNDKIPSFIYSNGYGIFSVFLRVLLNSGFTEHLIYFIRNGPNGNYPILNLPWNSKIRKLLQNTLIFENKFKLSTYKSEKHRNLNEVRVNFSGVQEKNQNILEIKQHKMKCYEIEIPLGAKIIMDNLIVKPIEIKENEKEELKTFDETPEIDFDSIRKTIMSKMASYGSPLKTIRDIQRMDKPFKIHTVGKFDNKGIIKTSSTRYGDTTSITGILYDETGEIKLKLWGDISKKIQNGDILEIIQGYAKNGILNNKQGGKEIIHEFNSK